MRHTVVTWGAGVRPSLEDPVGYHNPNAGGLQSLVDAVREWDTRPFDFASFRSVYGVSPKAPWREDDYALQPISPYAASKVADTVAATRAAVDCEDARFEVVNLGSGRTVSLNETITVLGAASGRTTTRLDLPEHLGDVPRTWADITKARSRLGYRSQTGSARGIRSVTEWLRQEAAP